MPRTRLAGTLWPDVDEERARHLLSNTLYRLRRVREMRE
jgi:DNA-binding SARP family transcriptional activator